MTDASLMDAGPPLMGTLVVTLWRSGWSETQEAVLAYLLNEAYSGSLKFVWVAELNSDTYQRLEAAWPDVEKRGADLELVDVPSEVRKILGKHELVVALYNEALENQHAEQLYFVEDDVVAPLGTFAQLREEFGKLPREACSLMAAYRSRVRPHFVCAGSLKGGYVPWSAQTEDDRPLEVAWTGGGCTLYRGNRLGAALPFASERRGHYEAGWDMVLSEKFRSQGGRVFLSLRHRAEHRCPELSQFVGKTIGT